LFGGKGGMVCKLSTSQVRVKNLVVRYWR
jgi:hypothetical protein